MSNLAQYVYFPHFLLLFKYYVFKIKFNYLLLFMKNTNTFDENNMAVNPLFRNKLRHTRST